MTSSSTDELAARHPLWVALVAYGQDMLRGSADELIAIFEPIRRHAAEYEGSIYGIDAHTLLPRDLPMSAEGVEALWAGVASEEFDAGGYMPRPPIQTDLQLMTWPRETPAVAGGIQVAGRDLCVAESFGEADAASALTGLAKRLFSLDQVQTVAIASWRSMELKQNPIGTLWARTNWDELIPGPAWAVGLTGRHLEILARESGQTRDALLAQLEDVGVLDPIGASSRQRWLYTSHGPLDEWDPVDHFVLDLAALLPDEVYPER